MRIILIPDKRHRDLASLKRAGKMQKNAKMRKNLQKCAEKMRFFAKKCAKNAFFCIFCHIPAHLIENQMFVSREAYRVLRTAKIFHEFMCGS